MHDVFPKETNVVPLIETQRLIMYVETQDRSSSEEVWKGHPILQPDVKQAQFLMDQLQTALSYMKWAQEYGPTEAHMAKAP